MLRPDDNPFGQIVGMGAQNVFFQSFRGPREKLEAEAKFLGSFDFPLPAVMRNDWTIDLHAGR